MNEEERKTMIKIGEALTVAIKEIKELKKESYWDAQNRLAKEEGQAIHKVAFGNGIEQTIEQILPAGRFKFETQFKDADKMEYEVRMMNAQNFLKDMQNLLLKYNVISLKGEYARQSIS